MTGTVARLSCVRSATPFSSCSCWTTVLNSVNPWITFLPCLPFFLIFACCDFWPNSKIYCELVFLHLSTSDWIWQPACFWQCGLLPKHYLCHRLACLTTYVPNFRLWTWFGDFRLNFRSFTNPSFPSLHLSQCSRPLASLTSDRFHTSTPIAKKLLCIF